MGNVVSGVSNHRRHMRRDQQLPHPPQTPQPEIGGNRYVFAAATPYPSQYPTGPNPNPPQYYHYAGYYHSPPPSFPGYLPAPFDHHHHHHHHRQNQNDPESVPPPLDPSQANWASGRYPYLPIVLPSTTSYIEHQKAITIRNDVNIKKETLRVDPDEDNPDKFLVSFTFDATVPGSITVIFFGKEGEGCTLRAMNEDELRPVTVQFEQGLGQKFRHPSGTGIHVSVLEEEGMMKKLDPDVFPLAVKAESSGKSDGTSNCQITQARFEKEKGAYKVRAVKQILWVNGTRYELQEIYGTSNSVDGDLDGGERGRECVICLSEPRDTTVLPCRHMCMCSECAKVLRFQTSRCPICRQPVERLLLMRAGVDHASDSG